MDSFCGSDVATKGSIVAFAFSLMINLRWLRSWSSNRSPRRVGLRGDRALTVLMLLAATAQSIRAQTGGFTYQGRLADGGTLANGSYDFQFGLTDAVTNGNHVGITL